MGLLTSDAKETPVLVSIRSKLCAILGLVLVLDRHLLTHLHTRGMKSSTSSTMEITRTMSCRKVNPITTECPIHSLPAVPSTPTSSMKKAAVTIRYVASSSHMAMLVTTDL